MLHQSPANTIQHYNSKVYAGFSNFIDKICVCPAMTFHDTAVMGKWSRAHCISSN